MRRRQEKKKKEKFTNIYSTKQGEREVERKIEVEGIGIDVQIQVLGGRIDVIKRRGAFFFGKT